MTQQWSEESIELAGRLFDMARDGDTETLRAYLEQGLKRNLRNGKGDTLLTLAAYYKHADTVAMLIEQGVDVTAVNDRGQDALGCATFRQDTAAMKALLAAGADPDAGSPSAREVARQFGLNEMLAVLDEPPTGREQGSDGPETA